MIDNLCSYRYNSLILDFLIQRLFPGILCFCVKTSLRANHLGKVKSVYEPIVAHQAGAYPGFYSMKRLGVFLLPPGWDASPSQGYPQR